jgi:C-terminal processing protease CtpA/Prc
MGAFDNMHDRPIYSEAWADYSITADIDDDALKVNLGLITYSGATAWWDNVRIEELGEFEIQTEPSRPFSDTELENLIAFTRLLGYIRHFHPSDQAAEQNWLDFIVAAIPQVEAAKGPADLAAKLQYVFHAVAPTVRVFETGKEPTMPAELKPPANVSNLKVRFWEYYGYSSTEKSPRSEPYSSKRLTLAAEDPEMLPFYALPEHVYRSDLGAGVSCMVPTALYADDDGTLPHVVASENKDLRFSTAHRGARLATVMTAWNILQHFYPYFDVIDTDWPHELEVALRKAATDEDESEFYQTLNRLVVALQDGHGSLEGPGKPQGQPLPLIAELIENQVVVIAVAVDINDIQPGDVLESIDGCPADEAFAKVVSQVSTATAQRVKQLNFGFGWRPQATEAKLQLHGADGISRQVTVIRSRSQMDTKRPPKLHEIKPGIFYADITRLDDKDFETALPELAKAKGIVFDMRGYPKIGPNWITHLSSQRLKSAYWNIPKAHKPDHTDIEWNTSRWDLDVGQPQLTSNRVFLTNGSAMSYAESLLGIVEAYKMGEIVGESTAGTNGNVCPAELYLGYNMAFTGMKVLKHDGSRHHGVGILPTVLVSRTIQGIRQGRDEQLEKALSLLK